MSRTITVSDRSITISGFFVRIGQLLGDSYIFLEDPKPLVEALKRSKERLDIFTFTQPPDRPKLDYFMEWDNFATIHVSTFDHWWTKQVHRKARNLIRKASKSGDVVREVPFNDILVQGISDIYNETPTRQGRPFKH